MEIHDLLGTFGVAVIVVMYFLLQTGRMGADHPAFSIGNAAGAGLMLISLAVAFNLSAVVMEVFWLLLSLYGLARSLRLRRR